MSERSIDATCLPCKDARITDLFAWNDFQPPTPDYFNLTCEVYVSNPGVVPLLATADPQGINPKVLTLDLYLCQEAGFWPQVFVWKALSFRKKISSGYTEVQIRCDGTVIAAETVADVQ